MIYGYIRVSTDKQTVENQRFEIKRFCERNFIKIDTWVSETISGTKNYKDRKLGKLLDEVGDGDLIICSEISRLGRSILMVMEILNVCMSKGVKIWTIKDNFRLGDDLQSKVLAFAFSLTAEIERQLISQRTKEGLRLRKQMGIKLGRPCGPGKRKLDEFHEKIVGMLNLGLSKRQIAKTFEVNPSTVHEYLNAKGLRPLKKRRPGTDIGSSAAVGAS